MKLVTFATAIALLFISHSLEAKELLKFNNYTIIEDAADEDASCLFRIDEGDKSVLFTSYSDRSTLEVSNSEWDKLPENGETVVRVIREVPGRLDAQQTVMVVAGDQSLESKYTFDSASDYITPIHIYGRLNAIGLEFKFDSGEEWKFSIPDAYIAIRPFEDCVNRITRQSSGNTPFGKNTVPVAPQQGSMGESLSKATAQNSGYWDPKTGKALGKPYKGTEEVLQ